MTPRILGALLGGVALSLAFAPVGAEWVIPFAVAAFFLACHGLPARRAWLPGLVFGVGFCFVHMFWMRVVGWDAWALLSGLEASFYGLLGAVVGRVGRLRAWPVYGAAGWVAVEVLRGGWPFSGMPWGRLSYATADTPWERALPYVGQSGVSLALAMLGAALAWAVLVARRSGVTGVGGGLVPAGTLAVVALPGLLPALAPYDVTLTGEERTVAVVQGDVPGNGDDILLDHRQVTRNHVEATTELADRVASGEAPAPDFVLWPENSTAVDPFADGDINASIDAAASAIGVPILVGAMVDAGSEHVLNQGIVWDPQTGGGDRYTKHNPVPFGEYIPWRSVFRDNFGRLALIPRDMVKGTRVEPLQVAGTAVGDAICFDVAYDAGIHDQLRAGAELLVVQTSNAMFIHTAQIEQQYEITRLRAIETGRYVLVAATNGVSGVIAPDGSVVAEADPRTRAVLVEQVGLSDELTPAVRIGPWLGRLCAALVGVALLATLFPYVRRRAVGGTAENAVGTAAGGDPVSPARTPAETRMETRTR
ncbi:apolipoprotein N-acyltransferase [Nocardioides sp. GCM10027113]|uniref:apolipoprotein N-acyltransferase n=1 Tax=unclassified Nocardioides TaxID=2615069 RepID=UPI00361A9D96